jgi:hypothetical protein
MVKSPFEYRGLHVASASRMPGICIAPTLLPSEVLTIIMKKLSLVASVLLLSASLAGCFRESDGLEIPTGSEIIVQTKSGTTVAGRLLEVQPERVVVESREGVKTLVARSYIASLRASDAAANAERGYTPEAEPKTGAKPGTRAALNTRTTAAADPVRSSRNKRDSAASKDATKAADYRPGFREVTVPSGTTLQVALQTTVSSDTSQVEDPVRGTLSRAISIDGVEALPAGTVVTGHVTEAERSGRVKGRARIAFRFNRIDAPGDGDRMPIRTEEIAREAAATKKQDAAKIGGGAAGGAIIGGILGGGNGAAKGAAIGGVAGTGVVLATRGKDVELGTGAVVMVRLLEPITVTVSR